MYFRLFGSALAGVLCTWSLCRKLFTRTNPVFPLGPAGKKLLLIMKLTAFILLTVCLQVSANSYAQRITLSERNVPVRKVLEKIKQQSGYDFFYNSRTLERAGRVSLNIKGGSLTETLEACFRNTGLTYTITDKIIVINRVAPPLPATPVSAAAEMAVQQPIEVQGVVMSDDGSPLAGASITVKGEGRTVSAGNSGNFSITVEPDAVLIFSFVGYQPKEVAVQGRRSLTVILEKEEDKLQGVVVVAYGTQRKESVTSAISEIKGEELTKRPVSNVQQSLQGLAPGVTVLDLGGAPGRSAATIRVRGITTFNINNPSGTYGGYDLGKNDALVIIDGIEQRLTDFNPDDIETITVLKDASSTAIYGSRATNGVILITTKRAKGNKVAVDYHGYYALQKSINNPKMMDLESYMRMQVAAYTNSGAALPARFTEQSINEWVNATDREKYPLPNTWYQTVFSTAPQHNHSFAVAGGNDMLKARFSGRYMDQDGIAPNYSDRLREIKLNTDFKPAGNLSFSFDVNYRYNYSTVPAVEPFQNILHGSLWAVPKYADGTYGLSSQGNNPLMYSEISGLSQQYNENIIANLKGEWEIMKGLRFSSQFGARGNMVQSKNFANAYTNIDKNTNVTKIVANNSLSEVRNIMREYTWNNILTYEKRLSDHDLKALAGYSEIDNSQSLLNAYRERFFNNDIQSIGQGTNDGTKSNSGGDAEFGLRSFFGRLNYAFAGKYFFEANGRYDGSSKFTENKRYSFFPSFSAGWRVSQESFWAGIGEVVNEAKLRASWGKTGNQSVDLYSYYASLNLIPYTFGGLPVQGYTQATLANKDLGWETTTQTNLGIDLGLLNNRVIFTADYYKKITDDILLNLAIPATVGLAAPPQNAGSVENEGFEFSLSYRGSKTGSAFRYNVGANFSINDNKVVDLKGTGPYIIGSDNYPRYIIATGFPINALWGYRTDGLFRSQQEVDNYPTYSPNSTPGDVKYVDLNEDGKIDANDMTMIGNVFPKYTYGLNADLSYGNFDLNLLIQGAADIDTRLGGAMSDHGNFEAFAHEILTNNYWTPENPGAEFPKPRKFDFRNGITSDRTILDGSYVRLKNIQLGYRLPASWLRSSGLNAVKLYVSGTNLITFSELNKWNLDPEVEPGVAVYYPQVSLYTFGVNVQF